MRILLADDEQIVLDGLTHMINGYEPTFNIVTAKTGREAIALAENHHPDVVFMDIKMPGIDGLEALKEIHRLLPQAILVVLSAYEQFEYARSAISMQVLDYIVKPIYKDRLFALLDKCRQILADRQAEREKALELKEKYHRVIPCLQQDLVLRIMSGMDAREIFQLYQELQDFHAGTFSFLLMQIKTEGASGPQDRLDAKYRSHERLLHLSQEIRWHMPNCLVGPVGTGPLAIIVPLLAADEYQARLESIAVAEGILRLVPPGFTAAIGVGKAYTAPGELSLSYHEALMALDRSFANPIRHYMDLFGTEKPDWEVQYLEVEQALLTDLGQGLAECNQDLVHRRLAEMLQQIGQDVVGQFLQRLRELEVLIVREARKYGFNAALQDFPPMTALSKEEILHQYLPHLRGLCQTYAHFIRENKTKRLNAIVMSAKNYVDLNYMKEGLSLEEAARQAAVTPYYLSRLFHAEMGMTFTDYLTKVRMDQALQLLREGLSIKEICFKTGYGDPNYFSRLFRKVFGVPPTELRREIGGDRV